MDIDAIAALLHPGDLSRWDFAGIVGLVIAFCVLPIAIVAFIIYRVVFGHSRDSGSVTLSLNGRSPKD